MTATPIRAGVAALLAKHERLIGDETIDISVQTLTVDGGNVMS